MYRMDGYDGVRVAALNMIVFSCGVVVGYLEADGKTRVVQGIAASGPVCMQARARDVVEANGLCIVGAGDTSVIVHYCRVSRYAVMKGGE